jgi:hypothetical protein
LVLRHGSGLQGYSANDVVGEWRLGTGETAIRLNWVLVCDVRQWVEWLGSRHHQPLAELPGDTTNVRNLRCDDSSRAHARTS